jgi:hypothetical protein
MPPNLPDDLTELLRPIPAYRTPVQPLQWTWERVCIRISATIGLVAWVLLCLRVIAWAVGVHG